MKTTCRFILSLVALGFAPLAQADCSQIIISSLDRGWYNSAGAHSSYNENYIVGDVDADHPPYRNWFVFNIPATTQQVVSASLRVYTFVIHSPTGSETYELRHVSIKANLPQGTFASLSCRERDADR